jgi:serine/threonine protein phosphatase PrpC
MRVSCPSCRLVCLVPREHLGKPIRCPGCKQTFGVRAPAEANSPPPAPPTLSCQGALPSPLPEPEPIARAERLDIGSATSPGRLRKRNEDSFLVERLKWCSQSGRHEVALLVVADGMGGHDAGDRASFIGIGVIASALAPYLAGLITGQEKLDDPEEQLDALDRALWEANRAISRAAEEEPGCAGMGSTAVAAILVDGAAAICHVGDCRAYLKRGVAFRQLTKDQTLVARMLELGTLTEREAKMHPAASQVTQALGKQYDLEPSRQTVDLLPGDRLVLACDGLHAHLDEKELAGLLAEPADSSVLAATLVDRANRAGGSDNCTVIVVEGMPAV